MAKASYGEQIRSIPSTAGVQRPEERRIFDAISEILRNMALSVEELASIDVKLNNVGNGVQIYAGEQPANTHRFRTLVAGAGIQIAQQSDAVVIKSKTAGSFADDFTVKATVNDGAPGTLSEKLVNVENADEDSIGIIVGDEEGVETYAPIYTVKARKLIGDAALIGVELGDPPSEGELEDIRVFLDFGNSLGNYDETEVQAIVHTSVGAGSTPVPAFRGIVTEVGDPGSDNNIPTEQAVREAIDLVDADVTVVINLIDDIETDITNIETTIAPLATMSSFTAITSIQYASGSLQYKTRTVSHPQSWIGSESGWSTLFSTDVFECP